MFDRHPIVSTNDPEEARSRVSQTYREHGLQVSDPGKRFHLTHNGVLVGGIGLYFMSYGARVRISPGAFEDFALVQIPLHGAALDRIDGTAVDTHQRMGSIAGPDSSLEMEWASDTSKLVLYIPRHTLEGAAFALSGRPSRGDLQLRPAMDFTQPAQRSWFGLVRSMVEGIQQNSPLMDNPLVSSRIADTVVLGLVANQWEDPVQQTAHGPIEESDAVDAVITMLEDSPDRTWRMVDLAHSTRMSARALSTAFQKKMQTTPMGYLQQVRLRGAYRDLYAATPALTTITEVATRWGFAHLSRFSAGYREAFGELPSETLRR